MIDKNEEVFFETIKCDDFEIFNLDYHKKRISNTIGLNISLEEYIYPPSQELLKCKVIYNKYEVLDISYTPYKPKEIKKIKLIEISDIEYNKKYLDRTIFDNLTNTYKEFDELIIVKNKLITDTTIANIAILLDNVWYTPKQPLLRGTTLQRYIDEKKLIKRDINLELFKKAEKIAFLNAMVDFKIIENYNIF